jgi:hypothetical protein
MATSKYHCSTNTADVPKTTPFGKESDVSMLLSSSWGIRGFRPNIGVVVRRGRYLNEAFKKGNDASCVVLVVASKADQGFPHVPNTNLPAHPPDPASKGATTKIKQGDGCEILHIFSHLNPYLSQEID